jgi:hypothetical protein
MKHAFAFVLLCLLGISTFAQSHSPASSGEFCPGVEVIFFVTVPGTNPGVASWTGAPNITSAIYDVTTNSASTVTTFRFKGNFRDANVLQEFRVTYTNTSGQSAAYVMSYKKIKSLFHNTSCTNIVPSQNSITWPFCEITTQPISFSNVSWTTFTDNPVTCFGSISTYEYQLPVGWSIGSVVSTGLNWIPGGNNVLVTSNTSNGIGETIKIRPTNSCGSNLANGIPPAFVNISRPLATGLTFSTGPDYICNVGETANFTVLNLPPTATVQLSVSQPTMAGIVGSSTSPTVTISKIANVNALVDVTAVVTQCGVVYPALTRKIALGSGRTTVFFQSQQVVCEIPSRPYYYGAVEEYPSANFYEWYLKDNSVASNPFVLQQAMNTNTADFPLRRGNRWYTVRVKAYNPCGMAQSIDMEGLIFAPSCSGGGARLSASAGADALDIAVEAEAEGTTESRIQEVIVTDLNGQTLLRQSLDGQSQAASLSMPNLPEGLYVVRVWDGGQWLTTKVLKN